MLPGFLALWNLRQEQLWATILSAYQQELLLKPLSFKVQDITSGHKLKAYTFILDLNQI